MPGEQRCDADPVLHPYRRNRHSPGALADVTLGVREAQSGTTTPTWDATMHATIHTTAQATSNSTLRTCLAATLLGLSMAGAHAANAVTSAQSEIQSRYLAERAVCLNGTSNQDRATCLKEAGAARDEARRGLLNDGDAAYKRNSRVRCDALTGDEAADCRARMRGAGTTSGSAQSGGIYRETVTVETKPAEPAASAAPAR